MKLKLALIAVLMATVVTAMASLPRNSYLVRPAKTHDALMNQAQTEPVLMDRYMRHFAMTRTEVIDMLSGLRLSKLDKTAVWTVYGVPKNGQIHSTPQLLRKGTLVWVDASGKPILQEVCGNPMTPGPKRVLMSDAVIATPVLQTQDLVTMQTMSPEPVVSAPIAMNMQPTTPTWEELPQPEQVVRSSRNNFGWAVIVPGAVFALTRKSNDPVPEPATMLAMGAGLAGLAAKRRKNKAAK